MFGRGLKGHLVQPWTLCQTVMGDTEMTQGVSEELSSTADREVQGKDLRPGHPSLLPSEQSNLRQPEAGYYSLGLGALLCEY